MYTGYIHYVYIMYTGCTLYTLDVLRHLYGQVPDRADSYPNSKDP